MTDCCIYLWICDIDDVAVDVGATAVDGVLVARHAAVVELSVADVRAIWRPPVRRVALQDLLYGTRDMPLIQANVSIQGCIRRLHAELHVNVPCSLVANAAAHNACLSCETAASFFPGNKCLLTVLLIL